ncbi:dUTP diphosphatase [Sulfitobacter sp. R18_1]|uniref:dUTP diphosphatase n=1 Tax=Sulfitobacter sp. R18_1 TaxID=2821104 RepID=UPI001ADB4C07|nr:dUTP diphosphatase [Sulfitobacter sp. R18_1]MBO9428489.1 dUTP diphosphatase [Sulfitobacter sp. R18_1]
MTPLTDVDIKAEDPLLMKIGGFPARSTDGSAGYDVRACTAERVVIEPGCDAVISTGFSIAIPSAEWGCFFIPRSGLGIKNGIIMGNSVGLIDSDYRGICHLSVWNRSDETFIVQPGMRVAQMVFLPVGLPNLNVVESHEGTTGRAAGGLGSTGTI